MNPVTAPTAVVSHTVTEVDEQLDALTTVLGLSQVEIAAIVGTTPRSVSRWRGATPAPARPRPAHSRRLRELDRLRWLLESDLGSSEGRHWLRRPNHALRGQAPLDALLEGDLDRVLGLVLSLGQGGVF
jgi:hypothetical protein